MDAETFDRYAAGESALPSTTYQRSRSASNPYRKPERRPSRNQGFEGQPFRSDYQSSSTPPNDGNDSARPRNEYQAQVTGGSGRTQRPGGSRSGSHSYSAGAAAIPNTGYQAGGSTVGTGGYQAGGSTIPLDDSKRSRDSAREARAPAVPTKDKMPARKQSTGGAYQAGGSSIPSSGYQAGGSAIHSGGSKTGDSSTTRDGYQAGASSIPSSGYQAGGSAIPTSGYQAGGSSIPTSGYQAGGSAVPSTGYQAGGGTIPSSGYQAGGGTISSSGYQAGGGKIPSSDYQAGGSTIPSTNADDISPSYARYDSKGNPIIDFGNDQQIGFDTTDNADAGSVWAEGEKDKFAVKPEDLPSAPLSGAKWGLLYGSLCLAVLCQALDNTILATALPRITDEFNSLNDVGWYGASYLLTTCSFQLTYGKIYNLFPIKWVFLIALGLFEAGSLLCGAAPSSIALIMGRVIAGIGSGGVFSGALLIIAQSLPLAKRPIYNGMLGSMYAIASIAGPLMGGAFTDRVTWRLCFYINLPMGFVTAVCVFFFLDRKAGENDRWKEPFISKVKQVDLLGLGLLVPCITCVLLALQWAGSTYPWSNFRIILLLVLFVVLLAGFIGVQIWKGDEATVPPSVIKLRTIWSCCIFAFFIFGSFLSITYYLPIWFQAIKGDKATQSGIDNLPSILATTIFSIVAGGMVFGIGYYTWAMILGSCLAAVGAGLISTFTVDTNSARWIGYQVVYGAGIGIGLQQPLIAVQTALPDYQVAEGTAIIIFVQSFGGSVMIAAASNVFNNKLISNVIAAKIPVDPASLLTQGATQLVNIVPPEFLRQLREVYNESLTQTFYVTVATAALSLLGSVFIPWLSVKKEKAPAKKDEETAAGQTENDKNMVEMSDRSSSPPAKEDAISLADDASQKFTFPTKPADTYSVKERRFSSFSRKGAPAGGDKADKQYVKELEQYKKDYDLHEQSAKLYDKKVRLYDKNAELYERNVRLYDADSRLYDKSVARYEDGERAVAGRSRF